MAGLRRYEIIDYTSPFSLTETSFFAPTTTTTTTTRTTRSRINNRFPPFTVTDEEEQQLSFDLDVFNPPSLIPTTLFDLAPFPFDPVADELLQIETTPFGSSYYKRVLARRHRGVNELYLQSLCDRVASLESKFDRLLKKNRLEEQEEEILARKYSWTAEIKGGRGLERKYKWTADIKGEEHKKKEKKDKDKDKKKGKGTREVRTYEWEAQYKGKGDEKRTYTWKTTVGGKKDNDDDKKKEKKKEKKESGVPRIVEIEEPSDHGGVILRQAFTRRVGASSSGKKELSPDDAAVMIQLSFRDYLIRRSRALRALRELAVAKTKLKEIRASFHSYSYRSRVARDAEERQKFSEKIIVLLLTVDAIEGVDVTVRSAKRSMVDELEAMLDIVDPAPSGTRSLSMKRRTFDMPTGEIRQEIAEGVAKVVEMLDDEESASE